MFFQLHSPSSRLVIDNNIKRKSSLRKREPAFDFLWWFWVMHLEYNVMSQCEITTKFIGFSTDPILLKAGFWVFLKSTDLDNDEIIDESAEVSSVPSVTIVQSSEQVVVKPFIQKRPQPFTRLQRPSLPRRINDSPLRQRQHQPTPDPLLSESDSDCYDESDVEVVDNFKENKLEKVKIVNGRIRGGSRSLPYTSIYFKYWAVTTTYLDEALSISIEGAAVYKRQQYLPESPVCSSISQRKSQSSESKATLKPKNGKICCMLELTDFIYNLIDGEYLLGRGLIRRETRWVNPVVFVEEFVKGL
ncbi:hypothetical protein QYM36_012874 [Artemia franciscana]|uniref:Uncharacterized protein n=1 Tax=Artemia franciscana TaxID=6661 RepID=A0AA88HQ98_ARTSF|nr:hypothetical protein QYM36_012874 [Artemia franciscana]